MAIKRLRCVCSRASQSKTKRGYGPITMTTTPTQRVAALRQRRKDAGLVRVEYYLTKPQAEKVKALISKLTKQMQ